MLCSFVWSSLASPVSIGPQCTATHFCPALLCPAPLRARWRTGASWRDCAASLAQPPLRRCIVRCTSPPPTNQPTNPRLISGVARVFLPFFFCPRRCGWYAANSPRARVRSLASCRAARPAVHATASALSRCRLPRMLGHSRVRHRHRLRRMGLGRCPFFLFFFFFSLCLDSRRNPIFFYLLVQIHGRDGAPKPQRK